jgi:hypothetical protein
VTVERTDERVGVLLEGLAEAPQGLEVRGAKVQVAEA